MSVTVISGVNELKSEAYAGRSVDDVRRELRTPLNIGDGAEAHLNGERVGDPATILRQGDELEFIKSAGEKGA
jgi:hypothetical protein